MKIVPILLLSLLSSCVVPPPPPYCPPARKTWTPAKPAPAATTTKPGRKIGERFIEDIDPKDVEPVRTVIKIEK